MEKSELEESIEQANNPEVLKQALFALLDKISALEFRLSTLDQKSNGNENQEKVISEKQERLERIRHGLTELNDRMQRPYVVSAELQAVKEVLDLLADAGECNSIILEGAPGTGKTQWAYSEVGQQLQEGKEVTIIHVRVKDNMRARDLLYSIDDVRRLSDAQAQAQVPEQIRQEATVWKQKILSGKTNPAEDKDYGLFKEKMSAITELGENAKDLDYNNYVDLGPMGEAIYQSGKGNLVYLLIDEIEKGREELMTGILDEIENLTFTIDETGTVVKGNKKNLRIVITTNTEDSDKIPPSFRRRSLYHFVDYPSRSDMAQIISLNFPGIQKNLLDYAVSVFWQYHENENIQKKPSTPELLAWIRVLADKFDGIIPNDIPHKEILLKYKEDHDLEIGGINVQAQAEAEQQMGELPHFAYRALQGVDVYHVPDDINFPHEQERFREFYSYLEKHGVSFATPHFEKQYDDTQKEFKYTCTRNFQIISLGVENLGNGYYCVSDDKLHLLEKVLDTRAKVLPPGLRFISIWERSKKLKRGLLIYEDIEYEGWMLEDGRVIINMAY